MSEIKIEISTTKMDFGLLLGPALAIVASFLPWITIRILGITRNMSAIDIDIGVLYFLLAMGAIGIVWKAKPESKAKWLLAVGSLMAVFSVASLLNASYTISMMQTKLKGNPFGALAGADIGIGVIIAIVASIIIIYSGYKLGSPDLSTPLPILGIRKVLMALNGILGLWSILILGFTISTANELPDSVVVTLFSASLIMIVTFFFSLYGLLKLIERRRVVYSAFAGVAAVLIVLLGRFITGAQAETLFEDSIVFGFIPLLIYIANLWYVRKG